MLYNSLQFYLSQINAQTYRLIKDLGPTFITGGETDTIICNQKTYDDYIKKMEYYKENNSLIHILAEDKNFEPKGILNNKRIFVNNLCRDNYIYEFRYGTPNCGGIVIIIE